MSNELEKQILEAQNNPLYKIVYDLTKDADNIDDAREIINNFGKKHFIDTNEYTNFLNNNDFAFFTENGRVPDLNSFNDIQFGVQSENIDTTVNAKVKNKTEKYVSKNTGGRKERDARRKEERRKKEEIENIYKKIDNPEQRAGELLYNIEEGKKDIKENINKRAKQLQQDIEEGKKRTSTENMYKSKFDELDNIERTKQFKNAASKGREEIIKNNAIEMEQNIIDGLKPILGDATDLKSGHAKITQFAKDNKINKTDISQELHDYLNANHKKIFNNTSKDSAKKAAEQAAKSTSKAAKEGAEETVEKLSNAGMKKIFNMRNVNFGINSLMAVSDFKSAREEGKGVIGSAVKAGGAFVAGEMLGGAMLPLMLLKSAPQAAIGGIEALQKMTRQMNSVQRIQAFGDAQFMDTQQLATMRQAGMEMAKMSQYNLQQSIMGNEAQHMHRI